MVVTDDLRRSRLTAGFRVVLAIPHLVWAWLFGTAATTLAFVIWLAVLFERRAPATLHRFVASYVRYTTHLGAYLSLAANPYPGFTGGSSYPVDVEIDAPQEQGRWSAGFRLLLAVPALVLAWTLGAVALLGPWYLFALFLGSGLAGVAGLLGWFVCVVRGRMPRGLRDTVVYTLGYGAQTLAYALLLTGKYPDASPDRIVPQPVLRPHPVALDVRDGLRRPRLLVAFRALLVIPHYVWLTLWTVPAALAAVLAWLVALVVGRVPRLLHRFLAAYVRTTVNVGAFVYLVGRPFPGFVGREGSYPIGLTIAPPERQRRLTVLFRLLLALPAVAISSAYSSALLAVAVLGWFAALVTGRMPEGLRDLGASALRYQGQLTAYVLLLTPRYPDSTPVLRGAWSEPEERVVDGEASA